MRRRGWKAGGAGGRPLTPREQEVLGLLVEGASGREVADTLGISPGAVRRIIRKLMGGP